MTVENKKANKVAKQILETGNFRINEKFVVQGTDRRLDPREFYGKVHDDCIYNTDWCFLTGSRRRPEM